MLVAELLLKTLEDLLKAEFDEFKWFLSLDLLGGCQPIPRARLQDASRIQTVDKLLKSYGEDTAVKITAEVLKKMKMNKATEELMSSYSAGEAHTSTTQMCVCGFRITASFLPPTDRNTPSSSPSSSSPSAPLPPSPAVMTAQEGSVIIAPTITVGTTSACNITISN